MLIVHCYLGVYPFRIIHHERSSMSLARALPAPRWAALAAALLCLLPITGESLWFDEGTTSFFAGQPTLSAVWQELTTTTFSESQMPGYILYMWGWEKLVGASEWALRMSNWPFLLALLLGLAWLPISRQQRWLVIGLVALSPFVWYNLDEARSTTALLALGGLCLVGVVQTFDGAPRDRRRGVWMVLVAAALGFTFNMLFYFLMLPLLVYLVLRAIRERYRLADLLSLWWPALVGLALIGGGMLLYYVETLLRGAGGVKELPSLANLGFVLYEFFGFNGLGPSREAMKADLSLELITERLPFMIPLTLVIIGLGLLVLRHQDRNRLLTNPMLISLLVGLASFFAVAYVVQFQFWGRHAVYLYPFFVLYLSEVLIFLWKQNRYATLSLGTTLALCWLVSAGVLRVDPAYQKRGAREAVAEARQYTAAGHGPVAWTTNWMVGYYYGLDFEQDYFDYPDPKQKPATEAMMLPPHSAELLAEVLERHPKTVLVWFKAFSGYDQGKVVATYLAGRETKVVAETRDYQIILLL